MFEQKDRVALITGGGRGIGLAVAEALARQGARVAINDLHGERADAAAKRLVDSGLQAMAVPGDVTDPVAVGEIVRATEDGLGPVDVLVNNAGIPENFPLSKFRDSDPSDWEPFLRLNLYAVLHCVHAVIGGMCDRGWGRVVTVSSEAI
jgi:NAD(P)-dependent dehydrogenase (short-subunit alcohol dehydrogenase family)